MALIQFLLGNLLGEKLKEPFHGAPVSWELLLIWLKQFFSSVTVISIGFYSSSSSEKILLKYTEIGGHGSVVEYQVSKPKILPSLVPDISSQKHQVVADVKIWNPGEPLLSRVEKSDFTRLEVRFSIRQLYAFIIIKGILLRWATHLYWLAKGFFLSKTEPSQSVPRTQFHSGKNTHTPSCSVLVWFSSDRERIHMGDILWNRCPRFFLAYGQLWNFETVR